MRRVQRTSRAENGLGPTATISRSPLRQMERSPEMVRTSVSSWSTFSAMMRRASYRRAVRLDSLKKWSSAAEAWGALYTFPS